MWKIAVFDADPPFAQRLAARIGALFSREDSALSCAVEVFTNLEELCARATEFDLAFLGSPRTSAPAVRRASLEIEIAFVPGARFSPLELLWTRPLGCISAPHDDAQLSAVLHAFRQYRAQDSVFFIAENRRQLLHVRHEDILYFESRGKAVYLHMTSGAAESFPARLDVVTARLTVCRYVRCHQSYLANLRHVKFLNKATHQLALSNGAIIPVSKHYYGQVLAAVRENILPGSILSME